MLIFLVGFSCRGEREEEWFFCFVLFLLSVACSCCVSEAASKSQWGFLGNPALVPVADCAV